MLPGIGISLMYKSGQVRRCWEVVFLQCMLYLGHVRFFLFSLELCKTFYGMQEEFIFVDTPEQNRRFQDYYISVKSSSCKLSMCLKWYWQKLLWHFQQNTFHWRLPLYWHQMNTAFEIKLLLRRLPIQDGIPDLKRCSSKGEEIGDTRPHVQFHLVMALTWYCRA